MNIFKAIPISLASISLALPAAAEDAWSSAAMACVPTSSTIAEANYVTTAGVVKFKDNAIGLISFICPVQGKLGDGEYYLSGWIRGSDESIDTATVQLRARNIENGATRTLLETQVPSPEGLTVFREVVSDVRRIDFADPLEVFWVQITIRKENRTDETVTVLAAELRFASSN